MRVAALYDIHGNLPALEAVLAEVREAAVDRVIVGGDIFPGPMAREALRRLRALDIPVDFIRGNCETDLLAERKGLPLPLPEAVRETMRWTAQQLFEEEEQFISRWPKTLTIDVGDLGDVLFCHATPRDDNEIFTAVTAMERLAPAFADVEADVVVCGHTHMQFDRAVGTIRVVNAGSVGMPFGAPGAHWLLIGPGVELRRSEYDARHAAAQLHATSYPQVDDFISRYVLDRPSAELMLEFYGRHELE